MLQRLHILALRPVSYFLRTCLTIFLITLLGPVNGQVLNPPRFNLAEGKKVTVSATCGIDEYGNPLKEQYCDLTGASVYNPSPGSQYIYYYDADRIAALSIEPEREHNFIEGGQNCDFCDASSSDQFYPPENLVDGTVAWWQSPPLSRGMQYQQINLTIDLEQVFHVAYVIIKMANSPRPAAWVLERSTDHGKSFSPWWYFAESPSQCSELFGDDATQPIIDDDSVICSTEFSRIEPLANGEIHISLINQRPNSQNFSHSDKLQNWMLATNIKIRLLKPKTLDGHLMEFLKKDHSVTRRYFYSIKDIEVGGRCVCHGHADTCDVLDTNRPRQLLCRCEHNTCGDHCETCCPGFVAKKWQPVKEGVIFECEACNCYGHSEDCDYDAEVEQKGLSVDIHGNYAGGGVCKNCRDNTKGINCHECAFGFYRPKGRALNVSNTCEPCTGCDPYFHTGDCEDETGKCYCNERFGGTECGVCGPGFYDFPTCKPCECNVNGTQAGVCLAIEGKCPCKGRYGGDFCDVCAPGFFNFPTCEPCGCIEDGRQDGSCDAISGVCACKSNFGGAKCEQCSDGYFNYPICQLCDCDVTGTLDAVCEKNTGACICKEGYTGDRCDKCNGSYFGYPKCEACNCDLSGASNDQCDAQSAQCNCKSNFGGKRCDKCAPGYFGYPSCNACKCDIAGSKGITCNDNGQCPCKANFDGLKCNKCKQNFYNYPICEECNCDPRGVSLSFPGCDQVAPGELCHCKAHVTGRSCNKCKPTFWNLQYSNKDGCEDCVCNVAGTLSRLNQCDDNSGQCHCKLYAGGRDCGRCKEGYFDMQAWDQYACQPCKCDIGGTLPGTTCDPKTGQCKCRPRVTGRDCSTPLHAQFFFPSARHMQYEAEEATAPGYTPVRFAIDADQFPDFSWKGYVVFSPIQDEIIMDVDIPRSSVYRVLVHYLNSLNQEIPLEMVFKPASQDTTDKQHAVVTKLPPNKTPATVALVQDSGKYQIFDLRPGKWALHLKTKMRLFLDYIVLMPHQYYEGKVLKEDVQNPCYAFNIDNSTCVSLKLVELPYPKSTVNDFYIKEGDAVRINLEKYPEEKLPPQFGPAAWLWNDKPIYIDFKVQEPGFHYIILEYYSVNDNIIYPVSVDVRTEGYKGTGNVTFHHCPYSALCREVIRVEGMPARFDIDSLSGQLKLTPVKPMDVAVKQVIAVPEKDFNPAMLIPATVCAMKNGKCIPSTLLLPGTATVVQAETGNNFNESVRGEDLPFLVADPDLRTIRLDNTHTSIEIHGKVPTEGNYVFLAHYFQPTKPLVNVDVFLQNEELHESYVPMKFCPSISGCRAVIKQKSDNEMGFHIKDKFTTTFHIKTPEEGPIYVDYVIAIPIDQFTPDMLEEQPLDRSTEFLTKCTQNNFDPSLQLSDFCRKAIFSMVSDFNNGAFQCNCNTEGSKSLTCDKFGGQCQCKENVMGKQCSHCMPGFFGFPECKPCNCPRNQQCQAVTGQCFCPLHVIGEKCDRCAANAFGFDPLVGCQECSCDPQGSDGLLECDQFSGICKCKPNVGGRRCDQCVDGYYGFPHCYKCGCEMAGATPDICDQATATCSCKENVEGASCEKCKPGTFFLEERNPAGCTECFCFGTTTHCKASGFPLTTIQEMRNWNVSGIEEADITVDGNTVEVAPPLEKDQTDPIYFVAPLAYLGKQIFSYGGKLRYQIHSVPIDESSVFSVKYPDVILKGHNLTLEYWNDEQPDEPTEPFTIIANLLPTNWTTKDGIAPTRQQMMLVLHNLVAIKLKASYFEKIQRARLINVVMDSAVPETNLVAPRAVENVEVCECPAPYRGTSCEECAPGYYRVSTGLFLGSCVPCKCNGHSNICDPVTGICSFCKDSTIGEHCEKCEVGYYGDPTRGTPFDCSVCPCPHPFHTNNFAIGCNITSFGATVICDCKPGYSGNQCERCAHGFYGDPLRPGGKCHECNCSGNNDLSSPGGCDHQSGVCGNCQQHTTGDHCEICEPWYFGDAVSEKNCHECTCNQCGSVKCDYRSGDCECKTNVAGKNCDKCIDKAWGFEKCSGCQMCECAEAAMTPQCDFKTGQCPCKHGAAGKQCQRCHEGFWSYSADGCKKCDCEADLAMGTVCDVGTGQCHCMEGATGTRCDQCIEGFLRVPKHGCLFCDECVHVQNDDLIKMDADISKSETGLSGLSKVYLTNRRLTNISSTAQGLKEEFLIITEQMAEQDIKGVEQLASDLRTAAAEVNRKALRMEATANKTRPRIEELNAETNKTEHELETQISDARNVVAKLLELAHGLGKAQSSKNVATVTAEAEILLDQIKLVNFDERKEAVQGKTAGIDESFQLADERTNSLKQLHNQTQLKQQLVQNITEKLVQLEEFLATSSAKIESARENVTTTAVAEMKQIETSLKNKSESARDNKVQARELVHKANDLLPDSTTQFAATEHDTADLTELLTTVREKIASREQALPDLSALKPNVQQKSDELSQQAQDLDRSFAGTREAAATAVEASKAYKLIEDRLEVSKGAANNASSAADNSLVQSASFNGQSLDSRKRSNELLRNATNRKGTVINELRQGLDMAVSNVSNVEAMVNSLKRQQQTLTNQVQLLESEKSGAKENASFVKERASAAQEKAKASGEKIGEILGRLLTMTNESRDLTATSGDSGRNLKAATAHYEKLKLAAPDAAQKLADAKQAFNTSSQSFADLEQKLEVLRRKVDFARDLANRVKLAVEMHGNASLQVKTPKRVTRSAAYTELSLNFKTSETNGLLFYLGNEVGASAKSQLVPSDDYMALLVESGLPKLVFDFGAGDDSVVLGTRVVSDNRWHKASIKRTGKAAILNITTDGELPDVNKGTTQGTQSVFNLHQELSKFFIGGVSPSFRIPSAVSSRYYTGLIDEVEFHGQPVGLWNFGPSGSKDVFPTKDKTDIKDRVGAGVQFNGNGYVTMERGLWNPRKESSVMLSFKTYARDGLLFYVGKERDFMSISLNDGHVEFQYDLGSGRANILSTKRFNNGQWHDIIAKRSGIEGELIIDRTEDAETVAGTSKGTMSELSFGDHYYLGGVPPGAMERTEAYFSGPPAIGFNGCIQRVMVNGAEANLKTAVASLYMKQGCLDRPVRVVAFDGDSGGHFQFNGRPLAAGAQITFKFKPVSADGFLFLLGNSPQFTNVISCGLVGGSLVLASGGDGSDVVNLVFTPPPTVSFLDGSWHYVTVTRTPKSLRFDIDDVMFKEIEVVNDQPEVGAKMYFGTMPNDLEIPEEFLPSKVPYQGCFGDATFNGQVIHFNKATKYDGSVSLVGCPLEEPVPTLAPQTEEKGSTEPPLALEEEEGGDSSSADTTIATTPSLSTTMKPMLTTTPPTDSCPLGPKPKGRREDSRGHRFGVEDFSRFEYMKLPEALDKKSQITFEFRATASNGIIFYAHNQKFTDYIAIYLKSGRFHYTFDSGSGPAEMSSQKTYLDGEWHTVLANRTGKYGSLHIDNERIAEAESAGETYQVETAPPCYYGGLPPQVYSETKRNTRLLGVNPTFGGCLTPLEIDGVTMETFSKQEGVKSCSEYTEDGIFFGEGGGYAILDKELHVGIKFSLQLEVKPRTKTGILLSVSASGHLGDYLTLQLVDGTVRYVIDNGAGPHEANYTLESSTQLCDGHWHKIKISKQKNLMTMNIDSVSSFTVIRAAKSSATDTRDPLFLGGVPEHYKHRGLATTEPFAGCVRGISIGKHARKKKNVRLDDVETFGPGVSKEGCPVN